VKSQHRLYREAQNDYWEARSRRARRILAFRRLARVVAAVVTAAVVIAGAAYGVHRADPRLDIPGFSASPGDGPPATGDPADGDTGLPASALPTPDGNGPAAPGAAAASLPTASQPTPAPSLNPTSTPSAPAWADTTVSLAAAAAASPAAPQVQTLLDRYFTAINEHDYSQYSTLLDPQMQQDNASASFAAGYATTTDSAETVTGISNTGDGDLAAVVTFTSHQDPSDSPDNTSCTQWAITLYLVPQNGGYLIGAPLSTYSPSYQAC
jgi:hypothetical protein